jgi:hypothetical protein
MPMPGSTLVIDRNVGEHSDNSAFTVLIRVGHEALLDSPRNIFN